MAKNNGADSPLTRDRILRAAVRLADRRGIEALSMRALGRQLGREAMSLYNHVAGKDDLLDGIVEMVIGEIPLPGQDTDWREAMRSRASRAREVFSRHPWAPRLIDSRLSGGPQRLRYFEAVLGTLRRAGFGVELAARAFSLIDSYLYGFGRQSLDIGAGSSGLSAGAPLVRVSLSRRNGGHVRLGSRLRRGWGLRVRIEPHPRRPAESPG